MQNSLALLEATFQEKIDRVIQHNLELAAEIQKAKSDVVLKDEYENLKKKIEIFEEQSRDIERQIQKTKEEKQQIQLLYNQLLSITKLSLKNADQIIAFLVRSS